MADEVAVEIGMPLGPVEAMRLAISEAKRGVGFVSPNPLVGCVIVDAENRFLASGYHAAVGQAHAEVNALAAVQDRSKLKGATFYITLEPCAHEGRTPSCAKTLAELPIAHLIYGLEDPNPLVAGQGAEILQAKGISAFDWATVMPDSIEGGLEVLEELEELAEVFLHNMRTQRPFVALKVATSLDGKMALASGESKWITGSGARAYSHFLRAHYDAVLIGRGTFEKDQPSLDIRLPKFKDKKNHVIILDPSAKTLASLKDSQLLQVRPGGHVHVAVSNEIFEKAQGENSAGVSLFPVAKNSEGNLDIDDLLAQIWSLGLRSIFIEGGAQTFAHFLNHQAVQRLHLFLAPSLIGGQHGISWTQYFGGPEMADRVMIKKLEPHTFGSDLYLTSRIHFPTCEL
jgi:diaminohydroxyphosphoribosylaminopyrimidine deaminase/5-amino-6-(5-phosphoribosylamino)uracil reductase